jgi:beta-galactosidase/beta-glucuronidase
MASQPRPEYPRPQFARPDWLCLNGAWQFEIDHGDSGRQRGLLERPLGSEILVPFCPESELSGLGHTDFLTVVWYRREVEIPAAWAGRRTLLHFQAVDYEATVWVNGVEVARHRGGTTPFAADLSGVAEPGTTAVIVVRARDNHRTAKPRGKQCPEPDNFGCLYTRTSGIWQTVWLEPVPSSYLDRAKITPDAAAGVIRVAQPVVNPRADLWLKVTLLYEQGVVAEAECAVGDLLPSLELAIPAASLRLWSPADPFLYGLTIELLDVDGAVIDRVLSYAGLRSVAVDGQAVLVNGQPLFQRLVLDQGYYPDGILTAPSDEALRGDIELSLAAGFNGARLHQKVFEERFLYWADKLGYLVWGEFPDWGIDRGAPAAAYVAEWLEVLKRDVSHPAIVGWCPLNETAQSMDDTIQGLDDITRALWLAAKTVDGTRPVLDTSGYSHRIREADIYDSHDYDQNPETFKARQAGLAQGQPYLNGPTDKPWSVAYAGQPYFVSEFGGIWWNPDAKPGEASWGYGERPKTLEEFYQRFEGLVAVLLDDPHMFGYCYTQLTDVFQEQNGIYRFDRRAKYDLAPVRAAQRRRAAIEG